MQQTIEDQSPLPNGPVRGDAPYSASRVPDAPGAQIPSFADISSAYENATRITDAETFHTRERGSTDRPTTRESIFREAANRHASPLDPTRRQWKRNILSNFHEYTGDDEADEDVWFGTIKQGKDIMRANEDFARMRANLQVREEGPMCSDPESCDKYVADVLAGCPVDDEGAVVTKDCRVFVPHRSGDPELMQDVQDFAVDGCDYECQRQAIAEHASSR